LSRQERCVDYGPVAVDIATFMAAAARPFAMQVAVEGAVESTGDDGLAALGALHASERLKRVDY